MRLSKLPLAAWLAAALVLPGAALAANGTVSGVYRANGKDAKLAYAVAVKHDDWSGQRAVTVVLTEKEPKGEKDPSIGASFGHFGSALVVTILQDGSVIGCEVGHEALKHMGASSIGKIATEGFEWSSGEVGGRLTTHGKASLFDETWEVDLTFKVKQP